MSLPVADNFNRPGPALGVNWTTRMGSPQIVLGAYFGGSGAGQHLAQWSADSFPADMYCQAVIADVEYGEYVAVAARYRHVGHDDYMLHYQIDLDGPDELYEVQGGAQILLGQGAAPYSELGQTIRIETEGNRVRCYANGVLRISATTSLLTAGWPALYITGSVAFGKLDDFAAGSLIAIADTYAAEVVLDRTLSGSVSMARMVAASPTIAMQPSVLALLDRAVSGEMSIRRSLTEEIDL